MQNVDKTFFTCYRTPNIGGTMKDISGIQLELQQRLQDYLVRNPGEESNLSETLAVSIPTIKRWKEGKNLPHPVIAEKIVTFFQEEPINPDS